MSKKSLLFIAAVEIILAAGWFLWYKPNKAQGGDLVQDLSGYMKTYPGESMQAQREKQGYNLNQYLNQRDTQTQETYNNTINTFKRIAPDTSYNYDSKPNSILSLDYDRTSGGILPCPE